MEPFYPLPELDDLNRFFWTSGADGRLRIQRCGDCRFWIHPPSVICPRCLSRAVAPQVVSGVGTVAAITVNHQPWAPGMAVPYTVGTIVLDDDPAVRITASVIDEPSGSVQIGQRVQVHFEPSEDVYLPVFRPL